MNEPFFPPQGPDEPQAIANPGAEAALIGAMLIDAKVIDAVADSLPQEDFHEPFLGSVYGVIVREHSLGRPLNPVTLRPFLADDERFGQLGGMAWLADLTAHSSSLVGAWEFARQIAELAARRRLVEGLTTTIEKARDLDAPVELLAGEAEEAIAEAMRERDTGNHERSAGAAAKKVIESLNQPLAGVTCGIIPTLDKIMGPIRPAHLDIGAARPGMGKTAVAVSYARGAAKKGHGVLFFSLEMSADELAERMLVDECFDEHRVPYEAIRDRSLDMIQSREVCRAQERLDELPIQIIDKAGLTIGQIRSMTRRWRRRFAARGQSLDLVIVDYLQLVRGDRKMDRIEVVSEVSRALKEIAKDNNLGVLALAQLSRAVEQRADKRPMLSDLRECLTESAFLTDADTGARISIKDVHIGQRVRSMDERSQRIVPGIVQAHWSNGEKAVFRLRLRSGRQIEATANHPIFTSEGWKEVGRLRPGDDVAVAIGAPGEGGGLPPDLCRLAGYMAGDGTCKTHREVGFVANRSDGASLADFKAIISTRFPDCAIRSKDRFNAEQLSVVRTYENGHGKPGGNPFREWLTEIGMNGQSCYTKVVPPAVFRSGRAGAANFILGYLQTDGTVKRAAGTTWRVSFSSVSRELLEGAQELLARLGVPSTIGNKPETSKRDVDLWSLRVSSKWEALAALSEALGTGLRKNDLLREIVVAEEVKRSTGPGAYALPRSVSRMLSAKSAAWRDQGKRMRRETAIRWAADLNDAELMKWAHSDLLWDEVTSIEPAGNQVTYDVQIASTHSFVANGIVVHNSGQIEQDADAVIFFLRPEYYLRKEGEPVFGDPNFEEWHAKLEKCLGRIEFICAKRRGGKEGSGWGEFLGSYQAVRG